MEIKLTNASRLFRKRLLMMIMRTFIFLMCTTLFSFTTENSFSQTKIRIDKDQLVTIDQVFKIIKQQTEYNFLYPKNLFKGKSKIQLKEGEVLIKELLEKSLSNGKLTYRVTKENTIIIEKKPDIVKLQQQIKVTGKVTDTNGEPLPGVTVRIKGNNKATAANFNGVYTIVASATDILVFTSIGFETQEVTVGNQKVINIQLKEAVNQLGEVVINAGYYKTTKKETTGSISKIDAKTIEQQPVSNVLATMQGSMAGVNITQTTGTPGGDFNIEIRGRNSIRFNSSNPLYIVDGVPYSSDPIGIGINSPVLPTQPSPLNSINPSLIESIEVLKDADATAIYGSRGANGVVLITTKKGKSGKTSFTANLSTGVGSVTRFMNLLNTKQYIAMRLEALDNDGTTPQPWQYDLTQWDQNRYTDWQKELMGGTAYITNIQTSLSGGSEKTQFLLSTHYNKQTTVLPGDFFYEKGGIQLNVNHTSQDKKFKSNISVSYTLQNNNQNGRDIMRDAVIISPNAPALYDEDGKLNWENNTFNNPMSQLENKYESKTKDLIANALLSYKLTNDIQLKSSFGYTTLSNNMIGVNPSTAYNPSYGIGPESSSLIPSHTNRESWIIEPQLNWNKSIGKGTLDALIGATFQSQKGNQLVQYAYGFTSNSLIYNLASASNIFTISSDKSDYKYQAFYGRVNYNFKNKYIINLTGRRDGSSRFGPEKQFATFGAIGTAWVFSKENLFKNNNILSFGKLRTSYGFAGSDQIGDYQYLDTYSSSGDNYNSTIGLQPTRLFNPEYAWESNKKFEIALETGFLNDRLFITTAWYDNRSSNQLIGIPLPGTTGFSSIQANLDATVQNKGFELTIQSLNFKTNNFNWTTNINFTKAQNKLLEFPNLEGSSYANQLVIGEPLNIQKVYHFTGVNPQTGIYTFEDVNGDGVLTVDDKKTIKNFNPEYFGGIQNTFKYKNWNLNFLFQFVKQINYNSSALFGIPGSEGNKPTSILNHWQQPGDIASHQIYTDFGNSNAVDKAYKYYESDGVISDASYIRLKNISLSYDLPLKDVQCKLFFEGQNLLTFTNYNGADPEFKSSGYLPPLRIFSAGMKFSF